MLKDFSTTLNGILIGNFSTSRAAILSLVNIIRPGEIGDIYYSHPHEHIIGRVEYEDVHEEAALVR